MGYIWMFLFIKRFILKENRIILEFDISNKSDVFVL